MRIFCVSLLFAAALVAAAPASSPESHRLEKRSPLPAKDKSSACKGNEVPVNGVCVQRCPDGKFGAANSPGCKSCSLIDPFAVTCTEQGALNCGSRYTENGKCVVSCGSAFYTNEATKQCIACSTVDGDAKTCSSSAAKSCFKLFLQAGACVTSDKCVQGSYGADNECKPCAGDAKTCNAAGAVSCKTQYFNASENGKPTGECRADCPVKKFGDASKICQPCTDLDAMTCTAAGPTECSSLFLQATTSAKPAACQSLCDSGFYGDASTKVCKPCGPGADTCDADGPLTCALDYYHLVTKDASTGKDVRSCTQNCGEGQYKNVVAEKRVCTTCSDPEAAECPDDVSTVCKIDTYFQAALPAVGNTAATAADCKKDCDAGFFSAPNGKCEVEADSSGPERFALLPGHLPSIDNYGPGDDSDFYSISDYTWISRGRCLDGCRALGFAGSFNYSPLQGGESGPCYCSRTGVPVQGHEYFDIMAPGVCSDYPTVSGCTNVFFIDGKCVHDDATRSDCDNLDHSRKV